MPWIAAFGKELSLIPVIFVLSVTAIKDAVEDYRRYRSDKKINNKTCRVWDPGQNKYTETIWAKVAIGDFIHLGCNEVIPADILILSSSDPLGICFVETSNLDGESNLKQRQVVASQQAHQDQLRDLHPGKKSYFHPPDFQSAVECEQPNNQIYRFNGYVLGPSLLKESVNKNNLLLRGCVMRNTDFVEGIVVYAGHETKSMMNNSGPRYKRSSLEVRMNWDVLWCVIILLLLCFFGSLGSGLWVKFYGSAENVKNVPFLTFPYEEKGSKPNPAITALINFFSYIIVLQSMIPLSLYVSLEIVKLGQIYFISRDKDLYHQDTDSKIECRALNIPEELGQIDYILSDKTGTLTENQMMFRRCAIAGVDYCPPSGNGGAPSQSSPDLVIPNQELLRTTKAIRRSNLDDPHFSEAVHDFFISLAVCNTVVIAHKHKDLLKPTGSEISLAQSSSQPSLAPLDATSLSSLVKFSPNPDVNAANCSSPYSYAESSLSDDATSSVSHVSQNSNTNNNFMLYEAESPDELSLVYAASAYGYQLLRRHVNYVCIRLPDGSEQKFHLLHTLPFDPVRKRMSVIVRKGDFDPPILFCKGADAVIMDLLSDSFKSSSEGQECIAKSSDYLNMYASYGLRTLCITKKTLSHTSYMTWLELHRAAELAAGDREEQLFQSAVQIETDLELLGVTGIEDRLQDGVPECIKSVRDVGISVWVLTGDKLETAVNVAYACKLFSSEMRIIQLKAATEGDVKELLQHHVDQMDSAYQLTPRNSVEGTGNARIQGNTALVIDGKTLSFCLAPEHNANLLKLVSASTSILCCRTTPLQKASIVKLVKDKLGAKTLAIGDGANDVAMIQSADVGVGINGQEGMQAVMASDFALPRFRFLKRLLLVHGHWCYDRLARTILCFFYENSLFVFALFWFQMFSGFSSQTTVDPLYLVLYSVLFTGLPPLVFGVLDQSAPDTVMMARPSLYLIGKNSTLYRWYSFWISIANAIWHSGVIFFYSYFVYSDTNIDLWSFGFLVFTALIFTNETYLSLETWPQGISISISLVFYVIFALVYNAAVSPGFYVDDPPLGVAENMMSKPIFYMSVLFIVVFSNLPRFVVRVVRNCFFAPPVLLASVKFRRNGQKG